MTWEELESEVSALSSKITITPDLIVAIVRGGLIPARLLSRNLHVKDMFCITIVKKGDKREILSEIEEDLIGKTVLLVEDVLESGTSLSVGKEYLGKKGAHVKTACLYVMPTTKIKADYYISEVSVVAKFPWE